MATKSTFGEGLRGNEFEQYLSKIPLVKQLFSGVFAIDEIPELIPIKHFIVVNLSPKHLPGSHWIIFCRRLANNYEVFNSLGSDNLDYITPFLKLNRRARISFNKEAVQDTESKFCGYFSLYFIIFRSLNYDMNMQDVLEDIFSSNDLIKNDETVKKFCLNLLNNTNDDLFSFNDIF